MATIDARGYFGTASRRLGAPPMDAWKFGLIVDDREWRRRYNFGLRGHHIPFQYFSDPDGVPPMPKSADWQSQDVPGRFEPVKVYQGSRDTQISMALTYYAYGTEDPRYNHRTEWTVEQIQRIIAKLEAQAYPRYEGTYAPPPRLLLNILSQVREFPVQLMSVSAKPMSPFDTETGVARRYQVNLEMSSNYPPWQALGSTDFLRFATERGEFDRGIGSIKSYRRFSTSRTR